MNEEIRPKVYISRCLGYEHCRFDGAIIMSEPVEKLKEFVEDVSDCPEKAIGLGVPRRPINIKTGEEGHILFQPATERDLTEDMEEWVKSKLDELGPVHGMILKAKSPSCGIGDVKVYGPTGRGLVSNKEDGFFGREARRRFGDTAFESEARLKDQTILDHFLTKLFTLARFDMSRKKAKAKDLIEFHSTHKFLLMAYDQDIMRKMGKIVADQKDIGTDKAWDQYFRLLKEALSKGSRFTNHINVLQHCFGYVSDELSGEEKGFFLDLLDAYRDDRIPLSTCKEVLRGHVIRFNVSYLLDQVYFRPYPLELTPGFEPKRDRELWR